MMRRFPSYGEGDDLGGEPSSWLVIEPPDENGIVAYRYELNPAYVPPPEPTELELLERAVREAEYGLYAARTALSSFHARGHR